MIKREKSIELLNKAVADEMTAVNQYMYFHFRLDDMGYDLLSRNDACRTPRRTYPVPER